MFRLASIRTTIYSLLNSHLHTCIARSASHCSCPRTPRRRSPARARPSPPGLRPSAGSGSTSTSPEVESASCWRRRRGLSRESRGSCRGASTGLPKPGGPGPQEPGLDILPADLGSCHHLSVIMNYDLIPARPRAPPGHCTPRHLDRQCHRTGLRWLPLQQGTSSCYLPARRPTGSPVPLPPRTRDERDQILGVGSRWNRWNQGRGGGATTEAGNPEKKQLVLRAVAGGGCGVG